MTIKKITQNSLLKLLKSQEFAFALIDVRERIEYECKQILYSTNIPRRLLEFVIFRLVPVKGTQIILYDDNESRSLLAAHTLSKLGYTNIFILEGGMNQWGKQGDYLSN